MDLTVLIPFYNGHDTLGKLLDSLASYLPVIIVDDVSDKPLLSVSRKNTKIIRMDKKGYFTGAVNRGLSEIKTDVLILNQDVYFENNNWLNFLEEKSKKYDLIGEGVTHHPAWPNGYIHGTFMYIKQDVYKKLGPMNEELYPLWGSTCEYQLRACRTGFKALPIENGKVPGFVHLRGRKRFGSAIRSLINKQGNRGLFLRTPPRVSVIITCHNYGRYLEDAVNSLIGGPTSLGYFEPQTFQSFDVIIVDDNSTDDSLEIANSLANDWKGVRVIARNKTGGTPAALNTGISSTRAHYITHLCADDMMETHRLQTLYNAAEKHPHRIIHDNLLYFQYGKRGVLKNTNPITRVYELGNSNDPKIPGIPDVYDFEKLLYQNGMHTGIFYPRKAWEEVGGYSEIMTRGREDWQFNVSLGLKGWCGVKAFPAGYLYRREKQNRTLTNTNTKSRFEFKKQMMSLYPEIYRGFRPMGCCGGGNKTKTNGTGASFMGTKGKLPGADEGMVKVEYIGLSHGLQTYRYDGERYEFGLSSPVGYIVKEHKKFFLEMKKNKNPLFKLAEDEEVVPFVIEPTMVEKEINPNDYTVAQLSDKLPDYSVQQLEKMLELEQGQRNRMGAVKKIEAALDEKIEVI